MLLQRFPHPPHSHDEVARALARDLGRFVPSDDLLLQAAAPVHDDGLTGYIGRQRRSQE